jgi:hypothetical protein
VQKSLPPLSSFNFKSVVYSKNNKFQKRKVMNTIYILGVIVIVLSFFSFYKRNTTNQEPNESNDVYEEPIIRSSIPKPTKRIKKPIQPEPVTKNKWLYPNDEFGKMEKGTVYESKTYSPEINSSSKDNDFEVT